MSEAGARAVRESSALAAAQVVPAALERVERGIAESAGDAESLAALAAVARAVGAREPRWREQAERIAEAAEAAGGTEPATPGVAPAPPAAYRGELYTAVERHLGEGRAELALDLLGDERDVLWGRGDAAGLRELAQRADALAAREGAPAVELHALAEAARHDAERAHWQALRVADERPAAAAAPSAAAPAEPGANGLAVASLVLGILWVFGIGSAVALGLGLAARRQITRTGESGRGMATAGIVLGVIGIALMVVLVVIGAAADDPNGSIQGEV